MIIRQLITRAALDERIAQLKNISGTYFKLVWLNSKAKLVGFTKDAYAMRDIMPYSVTAIEMERLLTAFEDGLLWSGRKKLIKTLDNAPVPLIPKVDSAAEIVQWFKEYAGWYNEERIKARDINYINEL